MTDITMEPSHVHDDPLQPTACAESFPARKTPCTLVSVSPSHDSSWISHGFSTLVSPEEESEAIPSVFSNLEPSHFSHLTHQNTSHYPPMLVLSGASALLSKPSDFSRTMIRSSSGPSVSSPQGARSRRLSDASESTISSEDGDEGDTVGTADPVDQSYVEQEASLDSIQPCRNLTGLFDHVAGTTPPKPPQATPCSKLDTQPELEEKQKHGGITPTGVAELKLDGEEEENVATPTAMGGRPPKDDANVISKTFKPVNSNAPEDIQESWKQGDISEKDFFVPHFNLHPSLQGYLSQPIVNRISFYGVIHDINKEAAGMAEHDTSTFQQTAEVVKDAEEDCPLVSAVTGTHNKAVNKEEDCPLVAAVKGNRKVDDNSAPVSSDGGALIDEEHWVLSAMKSRTMEEILARSKYVLPTTFAQAMGEQDDSNTAASSNPLSALSSSRTQLWKPSRSWWEAKSGKNPWIEPQSHNKRWRFLWPMIHYHKFLARCIKKLKRNGVDVKSSVSPVCVFLRDEVIAVSDHLASVSKFSSEEWMACLFYFHGWTDPNPDAEHELRKLVARQKVKAFGELQDLHSPLLRSQIDEQFLKAMSSSREQMNGGQTKQQGEGNKKDIHQATGQHGYGMDQYSNMSHPNNFHVGNGQFVPSYQFPDKTNGKKTTRRKQRAPKGRAQTWNDGRFPPMGPPPSMMHPGMGYHHQPNHNQANIDPYAMHHGDPNSNYYGVPSSSSYGQYFQPQGRGFASNSNSYPMHGGYDVSGWDTGAGVPTYGQQMTDASYYGVPHSPHGHMHVPHFVPSSPGVQFGSNHAPIVADMSSPYQARGEKADEIPPVPPSPFWGHLDHTTLAMAGLATPQGKQAPATPTRKKLVPELANKAEESATKQQKKDWVVNYGNSPLLLNPAAQFYPYAQEGYAPPSPATRFMSNSAQTPYFTHHNQIHPDLFASPHHGSAPVKEGSKKAVVKK